MPVSRKRKKKASKGGGGARRPAAVSAPPEIFPLLPDPDARRDARATEAARECVAALVKVAPEHSAAGLEDELSAWLGHRLHEFETAPPDDQAREGYVGPGLLATALVGAAAEAVEEALDEAEGAWRAPWAVLTAIFAILPSWLSGPAAKTVEALRLHSGGRVLPALPEAPVVAGPIRWARDAYGSRFGVIAPFSEPDRCYLWDIDACGMDAVTVHAGWYSTFEEAEAAWRTGVGPLATSGAAFVPVDEAAGLLDELMPTSDELVRLGGETRELFAEYYRCRRLAELALRAAGPRRRPPRADLTWNNAPTRFGAWLRAQGREPTEDLMELAEEMADSWRGVRAPDALFGTVSPHRVALVVAHLRDYYQHEAAAELVGLLPDWISWLTERSGLVPGLAQRSHEYETGKRYPGLEYDTAGPNPYSRVAE